LEEKLQMPEDRGEREGVVTKLISLWCSWRGMCVFYWGRGEKHVRKSKIGSSCRHEYKEAGNC